MEKGRKITLYKYYSKKKRHLTKLLSKVLPYLNDVQRRIRTIPLIFMPITSPCKQQGFFRGLTVSSQYLFQLILD